MKKEIIFNEGHPNKEGWYLVTGEKGGITSAYYDGADFYFLNVLHPMSRDLDTNLHALMMKISNVIGWSVSV